MDTDNADFFREGTHRNGEKRRQCIECSTPAIVAAAIREENEVTSMRGQRNPLSRGLWLWIAVSMLIGALVMQASPAAAQSVVKIGGLYPLTGGLAKLGEENRFGLQMAVDEINAAGGIKSLGGAKLEIVWGDTQGRPDVGINETRRLIERERVVAIIGAYQSAVTLPTSQLAQQLRTPYLDNIAIADEIAERGLDYVFMLPPKASQYASLGIEFLKNFESLTGHKVEKVAFLYENSDYGQSVIAGARKALEGTDFQIVADVSYSANAVDLTTEVTRVAAANPDIILTVDYLNDAVLIVQAYRRLGLTIPIFELGAGGSEDPEFVRRLGSLANGFLGQNEFTKYAPGAKEYNERFRARYGVDSSGNAAYAYIAGYVLADALERAGSTDKAAIRDALAATSLEPSETMFLPISRLEFDETGHAKEVALFVLQFWDGEAMPVWPPQAAVTDVRLPE